MNPHLIAIFPLLTFLLIGCENKEVDSLNLELAALREETIRLRRAEGDSNVTLNELSQNGENVDKKKERLLRAQKDLKSLQTYVDQLNQAVEHFSGVNAAWREAHRKSVIGLTANSMMKNDGTAIPNIEIKELRDAEILLMSDGVEKCVPISSLANPVRVRLVHEESIRVGIDD
jgi:hypothetical protein